MELNSIKNYNREKISDDIKIMYVPFMKNFCLRDNNLKDLSEIFSSIELPNTADDEYNYICYLYTICSQLGTRYT